MDACRLSDCLKSRARKLSRNDQVRSIRTRPSPTASRTSRIEASVLIVPEYCVFNAIHRLEQLFLKLLRVLCHKQRLHLRVPKPTFELASFNLLMSCNEPF